MLRTYKYLLRPNCEQAKALDYLVWQSRLIYNAALEQRIMTYQETGKGIGYTAQWAHFRDLRRSESETIGKLNASSLQHILRRMDKAFQAFFRRVKAGQTPGFPRFKGRERFKSIEYTYGDGCKLRQNEHGRRSFYVQNVGEMRLCYHRSIPEGAVIKHLVIKRENGRWYVCPMLELPGPVLAPREVESVVGVDVGLKNLLALSTGELVDNPRWMQESLAKLRVTQRHVSRQVKGSHRQRKAYVRLSQLHEQVANQRADTLHKITRRLVSEFDGIAIEKMSLAFMNRNHHLSLSSYDAGLGMFRQMLEYKAEEAGIQVIAKNPSDTTQRCSGCGRLVPKGLSVRVHHCPECGLVLDWDVNTARNILSLAFETPPGQAGQAVTWANASSVA